MTTTTKLLEIAANRLHNLRTACLEDMLELRRIVGEDAIFTGAYALRADLAADYTRRLNAILDRAGV